MTDLLGQYAADTGTSLSDASDHLMTAIAELFLSDEVDFGDADEVANKWHQWSQFDNSEPLTDLPYRIWEAFDAGEYYREDGLDPVERYTKPLLRSVLASG